MTDLLNHFAFNWFYNVGVVFCSFIFALWIGLMIIIAKHQYESRKADRDIEQTRAELKLGRIK